VRYERASSNPTATGCQTGTRALATAVGNVYPELQSLEGAYGCYNRRPIAGTSTYSLHAEGRAFDVGVPATLNDLGWNLACDLVAHRIIYGTMRVIWDRHIWTIERGDRWDQLRPATNQHRDHIHVEQYWTAAKRPASIRPEMEQQLVAGRLG
jgi:hypothetical protein